MPPTWPFTFRLVTFATTILFSVIVMCLSADLVSMFSSEQFSRLTLATSLLTILTVTPMLIIDKLRQGSILSYAGVEIVWPTILWVLWLTSGSYTAWKDNQFSVIPAEANCDFGDFDYGVDVSKYNRFCHEIKAVIGFSFILWILLLAYTFILLVLTLRAKERGHPAWTTSVRDGGILHPTEKPTESAFQMPVAQISTPYVSATQMTTIPQSYSQAPATPAPSYRSPTQRSLSMSVSPSIPQV